MLHRPRPCVSKTAIFAGQRAYPGSREKKSLQFQGLEAPPPRRAPACGKLIKTGRGRHRGRRKRNRIRHGGAYATALFELANESNAVDQVQADLKAFAAMVADSPDLMRLVRSPVFSAEDQARALDAVLDKAGISGIAENFLRVVAANRRLFAVDQIIRGFNALVAKHKGEVTAKSPSPSNSMTRA